MCSGGELVDPLSYYTAGIRGSVEVDEPLISIPPQLGPQCVPRAGNLGLLGPPRGLSDALGPFAIGAA